jgi:hypothetical protein
MYHNTLALTPGARLGPYAVTARIGDGGMGEVYQATDTNLKRQVAIKVLPESVAADAERLARFQREAEVPWIAAMWGWFSEDGEYQAAARRHGEGARFRIGQGTLRSRSVTRALGRWTRRSR